VRVRTGKKSANILQNTASCCLSRKSVTILINEGHEETSNDIPIYTCNGWFFCEVLKDLYIDTSAVHMHLVWSYTPLGIDTDPADRYTSRIFKSRNPNQPVGTTNRPKIQRSNKFFTNV